MTPFWHTPTYDPKLSRTLFLFKYLLHNHTHSYSFFKHGKILLKVQVKQNSELKKTFFAFSYVYCSLCHVFSSSFL